jgi:hypothetical protein
MKENTYSCGTLSYCMKMLVLENIEILYVLVCIIQYIIMMVQTFEYRTVLQRLSKAVQISGFHGVYKEITLGKHIFFNSKIKFKLSTVEHHNVQKLNSVYYTFPVLNLN